MSALAIAAFGEAACADPAPREIVREQRGDTTVVRSNSGGLWGDSVRRLRSRLTFEVFATSGDFLGSVAVLNGLRLRPQPVFNESGIVGLEIDGDGVPRLVRYRVGAGS